jgi:iron complex transport system ATP-binding protein
MSGGATAGLLLQGVSAGYRSRRVIEDFGLPPLPPGTLLGLLGQNAAGKSTLLRGIAGLGRASGTIVLDGVSLPPLSAAKRAALVGYLPQSLPSPSPLVAYEAVLSACRAVRGDLGQAQAEAAIARAFEELGITHLALRRMSELSGGQRQMVGLAQVMVREPRLLLLDEPTSALDLRWQLSVVQAVRNAVRQSGAIGIVAIHDINLAIRACDQVAVLARGRLLAAGPPAEVVTPAVLAESFGVESRVEACSQGVPVVLVDRALAPG